jgi:hypothetical protein
MLTHTKRILENTQKTRERLAREAEAIEPAYIYRPKAKPKPKSKADRDD